MANRIQQSNQEKLMDWEGQEERREAAASPTVRRLVTIDVSDKVHLEASLAKPKLPPPPPNKNHTSSSSSSSAGAAAGEAEREGGAGREAYYYHSNSNSGAARRARNAKVGVVITHPHPMLGGNMHNNVVVALFKRFASWSSFNYLCIYLFGPLFICFLNIFPFCRFAQEGFSVVRFNFRGTGRSTGSKTWRGALLPPPLHLPLHLPLLRLHAATVVAPCCCCSCSHR